MYLLPLVFAPNPIFQQKAEPVNEIIDEIKTILQVMLNTVHHHEAYGIGANMVGISKRLIVIDLQENGEHYKLLCINPEITYYSEETTTMVEGSLSFRGITAEITRPKKIKLEYTDIDNNKQTLECEGLLARVVQHEVDYLNGKVFLDYLSKMKRDMLIEKMKKENKKPLKHSCAHC